MLNTLLSYAHGWPAIAVAVLCVYGVWWVTTALLDRADQRATQKELARVRDAMAREQLKRDTLERIMRAHRRVN